MPGKRNHVGIHRVAVRFVAYGEALLTRFGVAGQRPVSETAAVGFIDDIDHAAGRVKGAEPAQDGGAHLGHLGAGDYLDSCAAQHPVTHHLLGGLLEPGPAAADPCDQPQVAVAHRQFRTVVGRADFVVRQGEIVEVTEFHRLSFPPGGCGAAA